MHRYYVSFNHSFSASRDIAFAIGTCDVTLPAPITSGTDLGPVKEWIASQGYRDAVILAFSPYAKQSAPEAS